MRANLVKLYTVLRGFTHPIFQLRLPQSRWFDPAILLSIHEVLHFCVLPRDGWKIDWTCLPTTILGNFSTFSFFAKKRKKFAVCCEKFGKGFSNKISFNIIKKAILEIKSFAGNMSHCMQAIELWFLLKWFENFHFSSS